MSGAELTRTLAVDLTNPIDGDDKIRRGVMDVLVELITPPDVRR
jgi:hypothetical protein